MEDNCEDNAAGTSNVLPTNSETVIIGSEVQVDADSDMEKTSGLSEAGSLSGISQGWSETIYGFTS